MQTKNLHKGLLALIAIVGALAVLQSGIWTARRDVSFDGSLLYLARFFQVAVYFVIAYLFRNHIPSVSKILALAVITFGVHLLLEVLMLNIPSVGAVRVFSVVSQVFSGVANASILLLVAHVFSSFNPKLSIPALAIAFLLAEILFMITAVIPQSAVIGVQIPLKIAGYCLVLISIYCKNTAELDVDQHPLQYGLSCDFSQHEHPLKFLTNTADWVFQVITAALIPFIFGFMSQLLSAANTSIGLHDVVSEVCAILVLVGLAGFCFLRRSKIGFNDMFVPVVLFYATGLSTLPLLWEASSPFAGSLLKCGMDVYQTVLWMLLACKSFEDPRHTYLYFGVFLGFANVFYGRFAEPILLANVSVSVSLISNVCLMFMWSLIVLCLVLFMLQRTAYAQKKPILAATANMQQSQDPVGEDAAEGVSGEESQVGDPFVVGIDTLTERCGLTRREREVLIEIIHGYSMPNVAKKLYISPETVRTHMKNIYRKTDTSNKQSLIHMIDTLAKGEKA